MALSEKIVIIPVKKDTLVQTVPGFVHPTVSLTHVNTRTDHVVVIQDGRVLIVPLNVSCPMEKIAGIHAVNTVSTRRVTEKMAVVCMAVNMGRNVMEFF